MEIRISELSNSFAKASELLNLKGSLEEIAPKLLAELGRSLMCQWGTYWNVSAATLQLRPLATWMEEGFNAPALDRDTMSRNLSLSEGTAGHVWRSKKPVWTLDLIADMCLPRSLDANVSGLTGGIWFALKTENTVYAVIELLGRNVLPPSEELKLGIESFGISLGHLLRDRLAKDFTSSDVSPPFGDPGSSIRIPFNGRR